ncbi:hypothetical protein Aduo_002967 [Ancylostoma duodenale]
MGVTDVFEAQAFIKFSKVSWPKKHEQHAPKRGGARIKDTFRALFVVGGPKELAPPVPVDPEERTEETINWDIWSNSSKDGIKCGSLVNWRNCEQDPSVGQTSLDRFLVKEPAPIVASLPNEDSVREGQMVFILVRLDTKYPRRDSDHFSTHFNYVQFDSDKNKVYSHETLTIDREKEEWLALRAKDIVLPATAHALPPDFTGLHNGKSISRCSPTEHLFAITEQSARYDNHCDEDADYLQQVPFIEECGNEQSSDPTTNDAELPNTEPMEVDERYEPYNSMLMDMDQGTMPTEMQVAHAPHPQTCMGRIVDQKQDKAK